VAPGGAPAIEGAFAISAKGVGARACLLLLAFKWLILRFLFLLRSCAVTWTPRGLFSGLERSNLPVAAAGAVQSDLGNLGELVSGPGKLWMENALAYVASIIIDTVLSFFPHSK
jgi:hypothetical protein